MKVTVDSWNYKNWYKALTKFLFIEANFETVIFCSEINFYPSTQENKKLNKPDIKFYLVTNF